MRHATFIPLVLVSLGIGLAACGSSTEGDDRTAEDSATENLTPEQEKALMRQAAIDAGIPISDVNVPVVSARTYTGGHIQLKVTGQFDIDASPELDTKASISDGEYTWIQYGTSGSQAPNATVTIGNGDMGVSVVVGRYIATATSTECSMTTNVTAAKVSGHFKCPKVTGYNQADGAMGDVAIEIEFDASS